jgi:hypothetical protein
MSTCDGGWFKFTLRVELVSVKPFFQIAMAKSLN